MVVEASAFLLHDGRPPLLLISRQLNVFILPVFDTTSPGQGGHLNCGGRRTPGIEPLRGSLRAAPIA